MKSFLRFMTSLRLAVWLTGLAISLALYGAVVMPGSEVFGGMNAGPLFKWLVGTPLVFTWWLWAVMAVLVVLAANTLFCSVESLIKKRDAFLLVISPQVIHLGFLFILLAHLFSSAGGFRAGGALPEGAAARLPNGVVMKLEKIEAQVDPMGYITDFSARVQYMGDDNAVLKEDVLKPNAPSFYAGAGLYLKTVQLQPYPVAVLELSRDPGAPWALAGGILFTLGTVTLLMLRMRQD